VKRSTLNIQRSTFQHHSFPLQAALTAILTTLSAHAASSSDWLQFRGPNASSVTHSPASSQLPTTLSPADITWKTDLPGRGLSSPVIIGTRLYLTAASGPEQQTLHILCYDTASGQKQWERRFQATGRTMCHEKTCVAAPTPASDGTRLYALFSSNDCFALDLDGNLLWLRSFTLDYPNASNSLGLASSPIIADGVLITQIENDGDSFTAALDPATGTNLWKISRPKTANWTSPTTWTDPTTQRSLLLLTSDEGVSALDPKTGKEQWNLAKPGPVIASSGIGEKHLAVPCPGKGLAVWNLSGGTTPPTLAWESPQISSGTASPLLAGPHVFSINSAGVLTCADLASGERPWKLRLEGPFSASPILAHKTLYAVSERGLLQAVDTTTPEGTITGKLDLATTILSTPSLSGNSLYLRSDATLWRIGK
jgi:outer membrane protein assembly factor BamB